MAYIDREKFLKRLGKEYPCIPPHGAIVVGMLCDEEPADVRPVVRGRWVKVGGFVTPGGDDVWKCSECGKGLHVYGIEHMTYGADVSDGQWVACPNCGAKMEGES